MGLRDWLIRHYLTKFLKGETMAKLLSLISGYKTYSVGIYGLLTGLAGLAGVAAPGLPSLGHDMAVNTIVTSLIGMFVRAGVAKAGNGK